MPNRFYDFIDRQGISFAVLNKQGGNGPGMILYSKDLIAVRAEGNAWRLFGARKTQPQPALQLPVNDYFGQYSYSFEILSGISRAKNKIMEFVCDFFFYSLHCVVLICIMK